MSITATARLQRKKRIRATISGTSAKPRMSVYRSNKNISVQLIDDTTGLTIVSCSNHKDKDNNIASAVKVGKEIAKLATEKGINTCVFDRNGYKYHGRVKALADAAREGGLQF